MFHKTVAEDLRSQKDRQRPVGIATTLSVVILSVQSVFGHSNQRGAGAASAALSAWEIGTCAPSTGASTVPWTASLRQCSEGKNCRYMIDVKFRCSC